jgi:hypothetical protein
LRNASDITRAVILLNIEAIGDLKYIPSIAETDPLGNKSSIGFFLPINISFNEFPHDSANAASSVIMERLSDINVSSAFNILNPFSASLVGFIGIAPYKLSVEYSLPLLR